MDVFRLYDDRDEARQELIPGEFGQFCRGQVAGVVVVTVELL